jgi:hypothetical protein
MAARLAVADFFFCTASRIRFRLPVEIPVEEELNGHDKY